MMEQAFFSTEIRLQLTEPEVALWRSQYGPLASVPFVALPTNRATRLDPQPFRVLLCRRLHFLLPYSSRRCRCGRLVDSHGHHRAACGKLVCLEDEVSQWRKLQHKCAGKAEAESQLT